MVVTAPTVEKPASAEELARRLHEAAASKLAVAPSGGGRVVKNVSGYDMMKLHYAALGSLGVIVAASFKVFPKPLHDVTISSHGGWTDIDRALGAPVAPAALELFSDGGVLARYSGSPDAVDRVVTELGWR